jgi:hypothetical protein
VKNSRLNSYLESGHRFVNGWLRPGASDAIVLLSKEQRRLGLVGSVAEIGVHHGKLFILLYLLTREGETAVAIDLFSHQELNIDNSGAGDRERFRKNLCKYADTRRLVIHEGDSTKLTHEDLLRFGNGPLRLFSIDGGHTPEITAHDLATADGALGEGGIIILDDVFTEVFPGVSEGVFRYFSEPRSIIPFAVGAGKTFFCHPAFATQYKIALRTAEAKITEHGFLGTRVLCLEFSPPTLAERIGKIAFWRNVKHLPPARLMRRLYHSVRPILTK